MTRTATSKTLVERPRSGRTMKRLTCYLSPELAKELAIQAIREDRSQSDLIERAVTAYLKKK